MNRIVTVKLGSVLLALLLTLTLATNGAAEVKVKIYTTPDRSDEPTIVQLSSRESAGSGEVRSVHPLQSVVARGGGGPNLYIPFFQVDTTRLGDATLWAMVNQEDFTVSAQVRYWDADFVLQAEENYVIPANGTETRNVRSVPGLTADFDGFARGFVTFETFGNVNVDFFQQDNTENLAGGEAAFGIGELCDEFSIRFLRFQPQDLGTRLMGLLTEPNGADLDFDDPTLEGLLYDLDGNFLNSFEFFTDEFLLDLFILDLVQSDNKSGTLRLDVVGSEDAEAFLLVEHSAGGRFTVAHKPDCVQPQIF